MACQLCFSCSDQQTAVSTPIRYFRILSARKVTSSQPATGMVPFTGILLASLRSLNQSCGDVGVDQCNLTSLACPEAPKSLTIHAPPSSLGLSAKASTSAGSICNREG